MNKLAVYSFFTIMSNVVDLDTSLPLSEVDEEDFLDYYNRMVNILQIELKILEATYEGRIIMKCTEEIAPH